MAENKLALRGSDNGSYALLYRKSDDYSVLNRLNSFANWCAQTGTNWFDADLGEYRDTLLEDLTPNSVQTHLSTLRQRIRDVATDNRLYKQMYAHFGDSGLSPADIEAHISAFQRKLENMANARHSSVRVTKTQDYADSQRLWLNGGPDRELLSRIVENKDELPALRDQALVALFLITGVRVSELCSLIVSDLSETFKGHPALRVRQGKGNKQRMIVYGDLIGELDLFVMPWVNAVGLRPTDILFQSFWRGNTKLRGKPLEPWSVRRILAAVELSIGRISPHDLRRTYARMLFKDFKMPMEGIMVQMGHTSVTITEEYVGLADIDERTPRYGSHS